MLNFQVDDLDAVLEKLKASGVVVDPKTEDSDYGAIWVVYRSGGEPSGALAADGVGT